MKMGQTDRMGTAPGGQKTQDNAPVERPLSPTPWEGGQQLAEKGGIRVNSEESSHSPLTNSEIGVV